VAPLEGVDLDRTPILAWRWRVLEEPPAADPRVRSGDDFAARVYVLFRFDPARAGLFERVRHEAGRLLFGDDLPMRAMNYVWSRREPAGARWDNPFTEGAKMISLGAGPRGVWLDARADLLADHATLFGDSPLPVGGVAVMSDSDQSCSRARAEYADLRFEARDAPPEQGR